MLGCYVPDACPLAPCAQVEMVIMMATDSGNTSSFSTGGGMPMDYGQYVAARALSSFAPSAMASTVDL